MNTPEITLNDSGIPADPPIEIPNYEELSFLWRLWYRLMRPLFAERVVRLRSEGESGYRVVEHYLWPDGMVHVLSIVDLSGGDLPCAYPTKVTQVIFE